ncbi:MAG TPA: hypothetical protein DEA96_10170 [Leptospiraceae bacterium]|nr:hypothetical protein [Spirochaetaceae bacterium]HBS05322.1 hypothetical protein [Leptospiraceae bacterium]
MTDRNPNQSSGGRDVSIPGAVFRRLRMHHRSSSISPDRSYARTTRWMLFALALFCFACYAENRTDERKAGARDYSENELSEPVLLDGSWDFQWSGNGENRTIEVPGAWNNQQWKGKPYPSYGKATYSTTVQLPDAGPLALYSSRQGTAWEVFVDDVSIGASGQVGKDSRHHRPAFFIEPMDIPLSLTEDGEIRIRVEISNFTDRSGGMWNLFFLGKKEDIRRLWLGRLIFDVFTISAILAIGLYHLALFLSRREDLASLAFSLVCLIIAVRVASTGEHLIEFLYPEVSFELMRKLEFLSFYLAVPAFLTFLLLALNDPWRNVLPVLVWAPATIFSLSVLFFPVGVYSHTLVYFFVFFALCLFLGIALWVRAIRRKDPGALASFLGGTIFALSAVHDILYASEVYITTMGNLAGFGLIVFLLTQSYLLARIFSMAFRQSKKLSDTLMETNQAYARFVPTDFLNHLNRTDIRDVRLGDQIESQMSILFTDIRAFTNLSERMSPQENFRFLNSYLKRVVPCITEEGGFVDKYIGDAVMALFAGPPEQALKAAIRIQQEVRNYNQHRQKQGFDPIKVGIGLHYGKLMLGTIGSEDRMESTVISDAVNTASRIERLTRDFGSPILISEQFFRALESPAAYNTRLLDRMQVKGKEAPLRVYEVLDGQPQWILDLHFRTRESFELGVEAALQGRAQDCRRFMQEVLRENPADSVAEMYLQRMTEAR